MTVECEWFINYFNNKAIVVYAMNFDICSWGGFCIYGKSHLPIKDSCKFHSFFGKKLPNGHDIYQWENFVCKTGFANNKFIVIYAVLP